MIIATDGGPNCNPDAACEARGCLVNLEGMTPACQPDGALNCCTDSTFGAVNCLDDALTTAGVAALRERGIPTFVVGVPGSGRYAALLDTLAERGGTARDERPRYYRVDSLDEGALTAALTEIAARTTASCELHLAAAVDPTRTNVYLDGVVVKQAGADGFRIDGSTLTLLGEACRKVTSGEALAVRVVAGCATVLY